MKVLKILKIKRIVVPQNYKANTWINFFNDKAKSSKWIIHYPRLWWDSQLLKEIMVGENKLPQSSYNQYLHSKVDELIPGKNYLIKILLLSEVPVGIPKTDKESYVSNVLNKIIKDEGGMFVGFKGLSLLQHREPDIFPELSRVISLYKEPYPCMCKKRGAPSLVKYKNGIFQFSDVIFERIEHHGRNALLCISKQ